MKVILLERVERLGALGEVVTVKDGFARNFLLPRSKALRANTANLQVFEERRADIEAGNAKAREAASKSGDRLDGSSYVMIRQAGESGQLYGSVSGRDVADAVNADGGSKVDRAMVVLDKPIKTLGLHEVKVRREHFDRIAQQAMGTPWVPRNPRPIPSPEQVKEILELAA